MVRYSHPIRLRAVSLSSLALVFFLLFPYLFGTMSMCGFVILKLFIHMCVCVYVRSEDGSFNVVLQAAKNTRELGYVVHTPCFLKVS